MKEKTAWAVFFICIKNYVITLKSCQNLKNENHQMQRWIVIDKLFMKIYAIIVPSINVKEVKRSSYYEKEKRS